MWPNRCDSDEQSQQNVAACLFRITLVTHWSKFLSQTMLAISLLLYQDGISEGHVYLSLTIV